MKIPVTRLFFSHLRTGGAASATLVLLVFVAVALSASVSGLIDRGGAAELRYQVGNISPNFRFLTARTMQEPPLDGPPTGRTSTVPAGSTSTWGALDAGLEAVREQAPEPLRDLLGPSRYSIYTESMALPPPADTAKVIGEFHIVLAADPHLLDSAVLVTGRWPNATGENTPLTSPVQIALSSATARRFGWKVGEVRRPGVDEHLGAQLVLTGTFVERTGSADYWTLNPSILQPKIRLTSDSDVITGTAFVNAADWPTAELLAQLEHLQIYFPLDVDTVSRSNIDLVRNQLVQFTDTQHPLGLPDDANTQTLHSIRLASRTPTTMTSVLAAVSSGRSVLAVLAVGPCGAAFATLILGCRLLARRRRSAFVLIAARGASEATRRSVCAAEALVLSLPAGIAAITAVFIFLPPDSRTIALILPMLAVLTPAAYLVLTPFPSGGGRVDASPLSAGKFRWIAEIGILVMAAVSTVVLYRDRTSASSTGLDPLVVASPLLICVAVGLFVMRVFPAPILLLHRVFRGGRGLVGFLGTARVTREPASGVAPILAILLGVATATLSAVALTTLQHGVASASSEQIGADLRVAGTVTTDQNIRDIERLPGIAEVSSSSTISGVDVTVAGVQREIQVYLVDTGTLASVQRGVPGAVTLPADMKSLRDGHIPVVVSAGLAGPVTLHGRPLAVVGSSPSTAGIGRDPEWMLADRSFIGAFGGTLYLPESLFVKLDSGADAALLIPEIRGLVVDSTVQTPGMLSQRLRGEPLVGGIGPTVFATVGIMALLCVSAVVMTTVSNSSARRRLLGILRTMGAPAGVAKNVLVWELTPMAIAALLGGLVAGAGLVRIVNDVIDLRPFTGGIDRPAPAVSVPLLAGLLGGFLLVVLTAILLSAALARRAGFDAVIKVGEV